MKASNQEASVEEAMPRHSNNRSRSCRKRRVQFEYDDDASDSTATSSSEDSPYHYDHNRPVKRRVLELFDRPKASLLTQEEKARLWMQPEDHRATLHDVLAIIRTNNPSTKNSSSSGSNVDNQEGRGGDDDDPNKVSFGQYAEALAMTFQLCDTPQALIKEQHDLSSSSKQEEPDSVCWNIRTSQLVQQLALWAAHHTCTRGVESKILPGLMAERQRRRTRVIRSVLELQQTHQQQQQSSQSSQLGDNDDNDDAVVGREDVVDARNHSLSRLSLSLTHSAKEFASALAVVDGRQALVEYMAMDNNSSSRGPPQQNNENRVPATTTTTTTTSSMRTACLKRRYEVVTPTEEDRKRNLRRISIS